LSIIEDNDPSLYRIVQAIDSHTITDGEVLEMIWRCYNLSK